MKWCVANGTNRGEWAGMACCLQAAGPMWHVHAGLAACTALFWATHAVVCTRYGGLRHSMHGTRLAFTACTVCAVDRHSICRMHGSARGTQPARYQHSRTAPHRHTCAHTHALIAQARTLSHHDVPNPLASPLASPQQSLHSNIITDIAHHKYETPTPIQCQGIPIALSGKWHKSGCLVRQVARVEGRKAQGRAHARTRGPFGSQVCQHEQQQ